MVVPRACCDIEMQTRSGPVALTDRPTHIRDTSKPRLVLEHQLDGFARRPVFADGGDPEK
jgi:hypothetical protein